MFDALQQVFGDIPDTLEKFVSTGYSSFKRQNSKQSHVASTAPSKGHAAGTTYSAKQSQAVASEDPFAWEARWKDRLATYAKINRETGVSL